MMKKGIYGLSLAKKESTFYNACMTIEQKISTALIIRQKSLSVAESCTGGLLAQRLTSLPDSSRYFRAGLVTYCNQSKIRMLGLKPALLQRHGAVSTETAEAMAQAVRTLFDADFGISITGIAGPSGGTRAKPVGTVFVAVATAVETLCLKCQFEGTRDQIRRQASSQALKLLFEFLD